MENLPKIITNISLLVLVFISLSLYSQDNLYVLKIEGHPDIKMHDSIQPLTKGDVFNDSTTLIMKRDDVIHYYNKEGEVFELYTTGSFKYNELLEVPLVKTNSSTTKKMISFLWKELTNSYTSQSKSGSVVRGEHDLFMQLPSDKSTILSSEIYFSWNAIKDKSENYYFILFDENDNEILTIGTKDTNLSLTVNQNILKSGQNYKWTITETPYPNKDKLEYRSFSIISPSELEEKEKEVIQVSRDLLKLGFSKDEIQRLFCEDIKQCF